MNGVWGAICDENWNIYDGSVICAQLGYKSAKSVFRSENYQGIKLQTLYQEIQIECKRIQGRSDFDHPTGLSGTVVSDISSDDVFRQRLCLNYASSRHV